MKSQQIFKIAILLVLASIANADSTKCQRELLNAKPIFKNFIVHVDEKNTNEARKELENFVKSLSTLGLECGLEELLIRAVVEVNPGNAAFCSGDLRVMSELAKTLSQVEQLSNYNGEKLEAFTFMIPQTLQDCGFTLELLQVMKEFSIKLGPLKEPHKDEGAEVNEVEHDEGEHESAYEGQTEIDISALEEESAFDGESYWAYEKIEHYDDLSLKESKYSIFNEEFGWENNENFENRENTEDFIGNDYSFYAAIAREGEEEQEQLNGDLAVEKIDESGLLGKHNSEQTEDEDYYDDHDDRFFADTNAAKLRLRMLSNQSEIVKNASQSVINEENVKSQQVGSAPAPISRENTESKLEESNTEEEFEAHFEEEEKGFLQEEEEEEVEHEHENKESEFENTEESFEHEENEEVNSEAFSSEEELNEWRYDINENEGENEYRYEEEEDSVHDILYDMVNTDIITFIDAITQLERIVDKSSDFTTFKDKLKAQEDLKNAFDDALKHIETSNNSTHV